MKKIIFLVLCFSLLTFNFSYAQTDESSGGEDLSLEEQLDNLLSDSNGVCDQFRKSKIRKDRMAARRLKIITRQIVRAVNLTSPQKCLGQLQMGMNALYKLVSDLGIGISCGPPILPPFLGEEDDIAINSIKPDCIQPDQLGNLFSEIYGLYTRARDLFHVDTDANEIPDACEDT
ncbi:MAG: hypothetical protein HYY52_08685 [Candidatus Melainabacteria bacterium]|nr:hypothetical protein [Candidatus Melainabacteria bacterium]